MNIGLLALTVAFLFGIIALVGLTHEEEPRREAVKDTTSIYSSMVPREL